LRRSPFGFLRVLKMPLLPRPSGGIAGIAICLALASAALAQSLVDATNPRKVLEIARGFGSAELEVDSDDAPLIVGRMSGFRYKVFFYGCKDGKDCGSIQFWTYVSAPPQPLAAVNAWNREYRFGRAYFDSMGDITIEMDVNLWGGVSPKNLDDTFDWWRGVMERANEKFRDPAVLPDAQKPGQGDSTL
jgi:hypothetical protein